MLKEQLIRYDAATGIVHSPPQQIFLELSGRCNLACVHCPIDYGLPESALRTDMPRRLIERQMPWLHRARFVNLNLVGEPLLAEHFDWALSEIAKGGAEIGFNTNAVLLSEERCEHLIRARVQSVSVSIDGTSLHQRIRNIPYEKTAEKIRLLDRTKRRLGSELPHVGIAYTLMKSNANELLAMLDDLLGSAQIHAVHVQPLVVNYETLRDENAYEVDGIDELLAEARKRCERNGTELIMFRSQFAEDEHEMGSLRQLHELGPHSDLLGCSDPFFEMKIHHDGSVDGCSFGQSAPGNALAQDIGEIWNDAWYRELRMRLLAKRYEGRCGTCPLIHGGLLNQLSPIREGVHHSRAESFFASKLG